MNQFCLTKRNIFSVIFIIMILIEGCNVQRETANTTLNPRITQTSEPTVDENTALPSSKITPVDIVPIITIAAETSVSEEKIINPTNISRLNEYIKINNSEDVGRLFWLSGGSQIGVFGENKVYLYSAPSFSLQKTLALPNRQALFDIGHSEEYGDILLINQLGVLSIWSILQEEIIQVYPLENMQLDSASFSPTADLIAISGVRTNDRNRTIEIRNFDGQVIQTITGYKNDAPILDFSSDEKYLAASTMGRNTDLNAILIWDRFTGELINKLQPLRDNGIIKFTHTGEILAIAGERSIHLWDMEGQNWLNSGWEFNTGAGYINRLAFSPNDNLIVVTTSSHKLFLIDAENGASVDFSKESQKIIDIVLSPDGVFLAILYENGEIVIWSVVAAIQ